MSCLPYAEGFCHGNNSLIFWHFILLFSQAGHFHKRKEKTKQERKRERDKEILVDPGEQREND